MKNKRPFSPERDIDIVGRYGDRLPVCAETYGDWAVTPCLCQDSGIICQGFYCCTHVATTRAVHKHLRLADARAMAAAFDRSFPKFKSLRGRIAMSKRSKVLAAEITLSVLGKKDLR